MPPRATASPARRSSRSTAGAAPARLGQDDGFGTGAAREWASPTPKATPKSAAAAAAKKKTYVGLADVLFLGLSVAAFAYALPAPVPLTLPPVAFLAMAVAVTSSHALYAFVWLKSAKFKKLCKAAPLKFVSKKPVKCFEALVLLFKTGQQIALFGWASGFSPAAALALVTSQSIDLYAAAAILFVAGQGLNAAIYRAIGADGVYYGFKLGAKVRRRCVAPPHDVDSARWQPSAQRRRGRGWERRSWRARQMLL